MKMKIPKVTKTGLCRNCKQWMELEDGTSWLPNHKDNQKKLCSNSRYSPWEYGYVIKTSKEALRVANFIKNDPGGCLIRNIHSLSCGDGNHCHKERLRLAQALAVYYIKHK